MDKDIADNDCESGDSSVELNEAEPGNDDGSYSTTAESFRSATDVVSSPHSRATSGEDIDSKFENENLSKVVARTTWIKSSKTWCRFEYDDNVLSVLHLNPGDTIAFVGSVGAYVLEGAVDIDGYCYHKGFAAKDGSRVLLINSSAHSALTTLTAFDGAYERRRSRDMPGRKRKLEDESMTKGIYREGDKFFVSTNLHNIWSDKRIEKVRNAFIAEKSKGCLLVLVEIRAPAFEAVKSSSLYKSISGLKWEEQKVSPVFEDIGLHGVKLVKSSIPGLRKFFFSPEWKTEMKRVLLREGCDVFLTCGPKNSGKSTFSKYLVNSLLSPSLLYERNPSSVGECEFVAYLECDLGQSEFTPPGFISLSLVSSPVTGPAFSHLFKPAFQIYVGDTSPKANPEFYLTCIARTFEVFKELKSLKEYAKMKLVVNTQGWVKGIGFHLLTDAITFIKPCQIFEIVSSKGPERESVRDSGEILTPEILSLLLDSAADASLPVGYFKVTKEILKYQANLLQPCKWNYSLIPSLSLDTEHSIKKEIASENRALSLMSYLQCVSIPLRPNQTFGGPYSLTYEQIFTQRPYVFHFEDVALLPQCESVTDMTPRVERNILKVFNGTTICLSYSPRVDNVLRDSKDVYKGKPILLEETNVFSTAIGCGFVRYIDVQKSLYYIICPEEPRLVKKANVFIKVPGTDPPPSLLRNDHLTTAPYLTKSFSAVLGGGARKNRRNLQRKKHS